MTDAVPRPLSGLELARAALVGLSAGVAAAPLLAAIDLPAQPDGLAPLGPAGVARGGSLGLLVALACLAVPRLRGRGPIDRRRVRGQVGMRLGMLCMLAGALGLPAGVLALLPPVAIKPPGGASVLVVPLVLAGAMLGPTLAAACMGGSRGRVEAAAWGAGMGCVGFMLTLGWSAVLVSLVRSPLAASAALVMPRSSSRP